MFKGYGMRQQSTVMEKTSQTKMFSIVFWIRAIKYFSSKVLVHCKCPCKSA